MDRSQGMARLAQGVCRAVVGLAMLAMSFSAASAQEKPSVVVVLAGGGAKGFAHLAVLRRLEKDQVRIAKIVGTSMGAVIGGLYASGLSTDDIERVMGNVNPGKVALDQLDRLELPQRTLAYQQQYPIDFEFGIKQGGLSFARGVSDGQRFLSLLQDLTANVPANVRFDELKIPFRAVATRYRDGATTVFDHGSLHLAIRASMAAPAVFAPVEINGETYVDGGLVANVPVEIALKEGADVLVTSFLGQDADEDSVTPSNALTVANRMLDILIRQNEQRNLALLRPQDILVQPVLRNFGFTDFNKAADIVRRGEQAVQRVDAQFVALARQAAQTDPVQYPRLAFDQRERRLTEIRVTGNQDVPASYIQERMSPLIGKEMSDSGIAKLIDQLYTTGHFERVSYSLEHIQGDRYAVVVDVNEKPYGPHFLKTSLGFSTEWGGVNQFSLGVGYRRPWLTPSGLELAVNARVGTESELSGQLRQPLGAGFSLSGNLSYVRNVLPAYAPEGTVTTIRNQKLAYMNMSTREAGVDLNYELERQATFRLGLVNSSLDVSPDSASRVVVTNVSGENYLLTLPRFKVSYTGLRAQIVSDQLDSLSFPRRGYLLNVRAEQSLSGTPFRSYRLSTRVATSVESHSFNAGVNLGYIQINDGSTGIVPTNLFLGGFQMMGAYRMAQLSGDRLVHAHGTYMYRWSDGGLLRQKTYVGAVLEAGDAWSQDAAMALKRSATLFIGVDSSIGDIYFGVARGSRGVSNAFVQLGRRFSF